MLKVDESHNYTYKDIIIWENYSANEILKGATNSLTLAEAVPKAGSVADK